MKRRLFALLSGVWLVLLLTEPATLHVCAVHSDGMGHAIAHAPAAASNHHPSAHTGNPHPAHRHSAQCSCLGTSSHSSLVVLPSAGEVVVEEVVVVTLTLVPVAADAPAPAAPDFLLPYPNAPPAAIA